MLVLVLKVVDIATLQLLVVVVGELIDGPLVQLLDLVVPVKDGGDGLQRGLSEGLDQVKVCEGGVEVNFAVQRLGSVTILTDEDDFEGQETTVDDVVLPLDLLQSHGVTTKGAPRRISF